jgi:cytidylate kinase
MNTSFPFLRTDTYLSTQWHGSQIPWGSKPAATFVTISREAGSGGASLARLLARKLNAEAPGGVIWKVFDDNLTPKMLKEHDLPIQLARFLPEGRVSEIQSSLGEMIGLHPNLWELVQKTNKTIRDLAAQGNVILVGRGANFATAGMTGGVHVRLIAPKLHRAKYLAQLYNISEQEALSCNVRCDHARRSYVKAYFDADDRDSQAYDLVINTGRVALSNAAKLVGAHVQALAAIAR